MDRHNMDKHNVELSLDGFRYFYRVLPNPESNLDPIVLLGGIFQSIDTWTKYAQYLNQFAPVILVDPPGSGDSDLLPAHYGADFLAASLLKVLVTERVPRANVVASSYSTPIAYRFGQLYPDKMSRMVLVGTMKETPPDQVENCKTALTFLQTQQMKEFTKIVINHLICQNPQVSINRRSLVARILRFTLLKLSIECRNKYQQNILRWMNHPPLDLTDTPDVSALIFTGRHDSFTKPEYCREMAQSFSDGVYTTVQNADHLVHIQQFQTTMELTMNFFMGLSLESVANCTPIEYFNQPMKSMKPVKSMKPMLSELAA